MKLGLVSVSFRNNSIEEIIATAKRVGLSCIEWGSDVHASPDNLHNLKEIYQKTKNAGLYCCSYGTYFRLGTTDIKELEKYIDAAEILGTNVLRLWCGNKDSEEYSEAETQALFDECKKAAKIAEKRGVYLCMECHGWSYTNSEASAVRLMQEVNSEHFKMYWQPNQFRFFEENMSYAAAVSEKTEIIHVFNWKGKERFPLADAVEPWKQYLSNFSTEKTLLLEFMPDDRIESLPEETKALKIIAGE